MLIPIPYIIKNTNKQIKGVIHVGGHFGQEIEIYKTNNINEVYFFEPVKDIFNILNLKCKEHSYKCYNVALGCQKEQKTIYIDESNEGQSSSLLKPKEHLKEYPEITFPKKETIFVEVLDNYNIETCNFLNIDVQGFELEVLKGALKTLQKIDFIYVEVNRSEMYEGCPLVDDIVSFLNKQGFILQQIVWYGSHSWGEALFIRHK